MYDVIIIGAGPAGISASLYTQRAKIKTLILYSDISSLEKTNKIENYYGFKEGINGKDLYLAGIQQAKSLETKIEKEEVLKIEKINDKFNIITNISQYQTYTVILATGSKKNKPKIKGIDELEGKGISYCAICDGFFYRNKNVVVLGSGQYAISETNDLINIVKSVTILTNGEVPPEIRADNVEINTKKIKEINGNEKVDNIEFIDGTKIKTDGVFIAHGIAGSLEFAKKIGAFEKNGTILVNEKMETNIEGLYACGDCTGGLLQISKAIYEGTVAGMQVIKYCKKRNNL